MTRPSTSTRLHAAGLKSTSQREAVLALLADRPRPATAQAVHAELRRGGCVFGLTTVYRTLRTLADAGLLHTFEVNGERAHRLCAATPHQHLVCDNCGHVTECPAEVVSQWLAHLHRHTGFNPHADRLELHGTCGACPWR